MDLRITKTKKLFSLHRGAAFADSLRYQRCIDLWRLTLQVRVARHSIVYSDTCFTAQALVRLMLDLQDRYIDVQANEFDDQGVPRFEDVYGVFMLLTENILGMMDHKVAHGFSARFHKFFLFNCRSKTIIANQTCT